MSKKFTLRSSPSPFQKQKLSPKAAAAKKKRDKEAAMTEWGKYKKRTAQQRNCPDGHDYDHRTKKWFQRQKTELEAKMALKTRQLNNNITDNTKKWQE